MAKRTTVALLLLQRKLRPEMSQTGLAEHIGVSKQTVAQWMSGACIPDVRHMLRIKELLGIPMEAWAEDAPDEPKSAA